MNKIGFFGAIFGSLIALASGLGVPLMLQYSPQNFYLLIMGIFGGTILLLFLLMISLFFSKDTSRKLAGIVIILPILLMGYFGIIVYQQVAPANAPYMEIVKNIDVFKMMDIFSIAMPVLMFLVMLPFIIWVFKFMYNTLIKREDILKNGLAASAKIIKITDNGLRVNNQIVYKITLEVNSPSQGIYQITKDFMVPHMDLALIQPGTIVKVKIDPNNKDNVVFDTWTGNVS